MKKTKKEKVVLFAVINKDVYERLREIKHRERKSIAQITREAIDAYLKNKKLQEEYKFDRCYGF